MKAEVIEHIGKLTTLYGQIEYEPDAQEVFRQYFEEELPNRRKNSSAKLNGYYARKNIHTQKLATAIHFADRTDMVLTKWDCEQALLMLENLEVRMHFALAFKGNNPLAAMAKKIVKYLSHNGPKTFREIWLAHYEDLRVENEAREVIRYLLTSEQIFMEEDGVSYASKAYKDRFKMDKTVVPLPELPTNVLELPPKEAL